jgi:hypothetical protein
MKGDADAQEARRDGAKLWRETASLVLAALLSFAVLQLWAASAYAGTLKLGYGRQFQLCRAYEQNLRSFPDLNLLDREWPVDPALKEFRKPQWRSVDARKDLDIIKTIFVWQTDPNQQLGAAKAEAKWQEELPQVLDLMEHRRIRLDRARVDFDADGEVDRVYRYYHPTKFFASGAPPLYGYSYIYFPSDSQYPAESWRIYSGHLYDSFLFRGRFYLIGWLPLGLTIQEPKAGTQGINLADVCIFKFQQ